MLEKITTLSQENIVTIRELQKNPSQVLKDITRIVRNGKTFGFFFSQVEFEDLIEDLKALASSQYTRDIAKADHQIKKGKTVSLKALKTKYGLSS